MIRVDIKRTDFYKGLSKNNAQKYFDTTNYKTISEIDNIYYSVKLKEDNNRNIAFDKLFEELNILRSVFLDKKEPIEYKENLFIDLKSFYLYKYCLSCPDLFDIFIIDYIPNENTPRFIIQLRSYGLWIYGWEYMLEKSYNALNEILCDYRMEIEEIKENRLDYCFHTNILKNPDNMFSDKKLEQHLKTNLSSFHMTGNVEYEDNKAILKKDYLALGQRKSNNVFVRFYNKTREVIEIGQKGYFFEIWFQNGLISFYDKFCYEYAYNTKNYDDLERAKILFYLKYGINDERLEEARLLLEKNNLNEIKTFNKGLMPDLTVVFNVEFETKRKFYYYSDEQIKEKLVTKENNLAKPLQRLCKIIYNRNIFLDYLTSTTVSFKNNDDEYMDWWNRLRNTSIDCISKDIDLIRNYQKNLNHDMVIKRTINNIASVTVYQDKNINNDFIEDCQNFLSLLNDNDVYEFNSLDKDVILDGFHSEYLRGYQNKKKTIFNRIKNQL